jgi:hypothetical protein
MAPRDRALAEGTLKIGVLIPNKSPHLETRAGDLSQTHNRLGLATERDCPKALAREVFHTPNAGLPRREKILEFN